jgi:hypothetical protein
MFVSTEMNLRFPQKLVKCLDYLNVYRLFKKDSMNCCVVITVVVVVVVVVVIIIIIIIIIISTTYTTAI